jgi:hypothetical protein
MCLGREVQSSFILLSCIAVLFGGTSAFGIEAGRNVSVHAGSGGSVISGFCPSPCGCVCGPAFLSSERWGPSSRLCHSSVPVSAMLISDGPAGGCLSAPGSLCVFAMDDGRAWARPPPCEA